MEDNLLSNHIKQLIDILVKEGDMPVVIKDNHNHRAYQIHEGFLEVQNIRMPSTWDVRPLESGDTKALVIG